ncbi:4Fe-4S binding protein [Archaeoglobus veneficus]|uniref:4Fe-4S ferredoxin iron-sulfur binding domain-containing protein n=1 Tax=Archaeoglobus veneficus (strain DSM 11195 / SNP6) TaxID=693661 RepID=F2KRH2_ARCVS|nr:4Fe-4S binding protein [Archaeoglobus veneficus]AEA46737.1 4Fe-4S ferredoxin iron-sulfur binding domain-containing protein [Archaeoglobus veneficus SNP6]
MHKCVVLCKGCTGLNLDKIASKISDAEVIIVNDCKVKVEYSFVVFGCPAIPHASGYSGNYEIVDLRMVESLFENPEDVASAWINSSLVFSEPEVESVEMGYDIVYEGDNVEIISELALNANVTVVTSNVETIKSLYPFRVRVIEGRIEDVRGKVGNFEVIVDGVDVTTQKRGKIVVKAGQVITPHAEEKEGVFTGDEYRAALKAVNNLGSFIRIKAVDVNYHVCGTAKSGIPGCSLCLSCPTGSIERYNDGLKINLESCTGCGFCAAVCPVSAIRNTILPSEVLLEKIDAALSAESEKKVVAFVCQNALGDFYEMWRNCCEKLPPVLPVIVPCINSVSEIHYLYAILRGADGVVAIPCECEVRYDALEIAKATLEAFGFDGIRVARAAELKDVDFGNVPGKLLDSPPEGETKRQKWLYMVERLMAFPLRKDKFQIKQFGKIEIGDTCTLCRACASFCPANAIVRDIENGRILFTHALCFACNLCVGVCPENAIKLENVLDFNSLAESVVFEDEIIRCPSCGKPHITRRAYEKIRVLSKMENALLFCPDCRPRVILESIYEEIMDERGRREKL